MLSRLSSSVSPSKRRRSTFVPLLTMAISESSTDLSAATLLLVSKIVNSLRCISALCAGGCSRE